jgi:hypothetical protein
MAAPPKSAGSPQPTRVLAETRTAKQSERARVIFMVGFSCGCELLIGGAAATLRGLDVEFSLAAIGARIGPGSGAAAIDSARSAGV